MTIERKTIGKKTRFEVFKRDSFTCQYCGKKAPNVVLVIDHIKPVKTGGESNVLNYVTSCVDCNAGKGGRELSDSQTVSKQMEQLTLLNEKREQLEMILKWKQGLDKIGDYELKKAEEYYSSLTGWQHTDYGLTVLRPMVKKYGLSIIIDSINDAYNQYADVKDGIVTKESMQKVSSMIGKIAHVKKDSEGKPYLKDLFYCRGILNNRFRYVDKSMAIQLLTEAYLSGSTVEQLKTLCSQTRNWTNFVSEIQERIGGSDG